MSGIVLILLWRRGVIRLSLLGVALFCFLLPAGVWGKEVIPPSPARYFNDYANVVPAADADLFNQELDQFERDTSNQIVVAVYPKMESDSDIADYTFRVKEAWHVGQKGKNNGAVLFVFIQDHTLFIQVNYGLEGALPDATCKQIIDQEITPKFKKGDYSGGLGAGINAILAATKGEYKGNGGTANDVPVSDATVNVIFYLLCTIVIGFLLLGPFFLFMNYFGGTFYQRHARLLTFGENAYLMIWKIGLVLLFSRGGGGSSGGGSSGGGSSGGGGFSGGGGTGGGGGAGGSW
jgi:uncharacterized protein